MAVLMCACPGCGTQIDATSRRCHHCGLLPEPGWADGQTKVIPRLTRIQRLKASLRY